MPPPVPVIASDAHLAHDGLVELVAGREVPCFEAPARAIEIRRALEARGGYAVGEPTGHGLEPILAVHDHVLVDLLEHVWTDAMAAGLDPSRPLIPDTFLTRAYDGGMGVTTLPVARHEQLGAFCFDTATPLVAGSYGAARAAVDVALGAMERVLAGAPLAYGLCRPPGHHAARSMFGGYCLFNNAAIVAERLVSLGATRVAILDIDYHHGNGTQSIFWERPDVLYVSIHADPRDAYPYFSGAADESGAGRGAGFTRNLPLPRGTDGAAYATALTDACAMVDAFDPDGPLVVSLGFDTYADDPIGGFALRTDDYATLGTLVRGLGRETVVLQEGGYAVEAIGANAVAFLDALAGRERQAAASAPSAATSSSASATE
jgi:acetoin utilization deacetylase AcuC-like enzyme